MLGVSISSFISVGTEYLVDLRLQMMLLAALSIVNITYTLWCMKNTLHILSSSRAAIRFSMLPCYYVKH